MPMSLPAKIEGIGIEATRISITLLPFSSTMLERSAPASSEFSMKRTKIAKVPSVSAVWSRGGAAALPGDFGRATVTASKRGAAARMPVSAPSMPAWRTARRSHASTAISRSRSVETLSLRRRMRAPSSVTRSTAPKRSLPGRSRRSAWRRASAASRGAGVTRVIASSRASAPKRRAISPTPRSYSRSTPSKRASSSAASCAGKSVSAGADSTSGSAPSACAARYRARSFA